MEQQTVDESVTVESSSPVSVWLKKGSSPLQRLLGAIAIAFALGIGPATQAW